jgi:lysophospholipase L1-like esterase
VNWLYIKKIILVIYISVFLFLILGMILHSSIHPQLFGKYTYKYLVILIFLIASFLISVWAYYYFLLEKKLKLFSKRRVALPTRNFLLVIVLILVLLVPIELYYRHKYNDYETNNYLWTINNFHPFLQLQNSNDKPGNPLHFDSHGFRADEITKDKPKGTYRIFVLGGSTVLDSGVDFESSAPRLLEKMLQEKYPNAKIQVINAGVDGYTSEHSLIQYLFNIKDFHPDMIIMWHGINDWYYSCEPPKYSHGLYKSDYSHYYNLEARMAFNNFHPAPVVQFKLLALNRIAKVLGDNLYSDLLAKLQSRQVPTGGIYAGSELKDTYDTPVVKSLPSFKRNIASLIQVLNTDHVSLVLADQPYLYSNSLNDHDKSMLSFPKNGCSNTDGKYPSMNSMITSLNMYNDASKDIAKENNIPFVDIASAVPKTSRYFLDDVHYTRDGNKKVAQALFDYMVKNNVLPFASSSNK